MQNKFHLAQLNIADAKADPTSFLMSGFYQRIDEINELAEHTSGFIWRYKDTEPKAAQRIFNHSALVINMSVWQDLDVLKQFVYQTTHKELIKGRKDWFHKMPETHQVLWWIKAGHTPNLKEAKQKLDLIRDQGPTLDAFNFVKPFDPQ